jgi:hypothetical protein
MKTKIDLKNIITFLSIISVLLIIGISFLTWRFCDDFRYEKTLSSQGVFHYMYNLYSTFDGRFISIASFIQLSLIKYLDLKVVVFIWALLFTINGFLISKIFLDELGYKIILSKWTFLFVSLLTCLGLFYGFYAHISETVFWAVGGAYMVHMFLGLTWLIISKKVLREPEKKFNLALFLLYTFIVGMLTQNLVVCLIVFLFLEIILNFNISERKLLYYRIALIVLLILGALIVSLSPGSLYRIKQYKGSFDTNAIHYLGYFYFTLKVFLRASIVLIPSAIFIGYILVLNVPELFYSEEQHYKKNFLNFIRNVKWIIIALSSIVPFLLVPKTVCYRTSLFFQIFLFTGLVLFTINFLRKIHFKNIKIIRKTVNILVITGLTVSLLFLIYNYKIGIRYQRHMNENDKYLVSMKGSQDTVVVSDLELRYKPFVFNLRDWTLTEDPNTWINKEWSFYYDIQNIRIDKKKKTF